MSIRVVVSLLAFLLAAHWAGPVLAVQPTGKEPVSPTKASHAARSPILFVENMGQWDGRARFQAWGSAAGSLWLAEDAIWMTVLEKEETGKPADQPLDLGFRRLPNAGKMPALRGGVNVKLNFPGANLQPGIEAFERLDTIVSYFYGNDPDQWRPAVPVWGGVRYVDLYPGIDLEITGDAGRLALRLVARPDADFSPDAVRLRVEGADAVTVNGDELRLSTSAGELALPLLWGEGLPLASPQVTISGAQDFEVAVPFAPLRPAPQALALSLPADNPADLLYSTFLGGGQEDFGYAIALDSAGGAIVTGETASNDFPTTPGAFDPSSNGSNAFVVKLNPDGSRLVYATFLGGSDFDFAYAIALDEAGSAIVTGYTRSSDFPTTPGAFDASYDGFGDAFVARLNPAGSELTYATFLGGSEGEYGRGVAVDETGSAAVTGWTDSRDFPVTPGAFDGSYNSGDRYGNDAFVARLNSAGSELVYATFLGGAENDEGYGIAMDAAGSVVVAGYTESGDFPATPEAIDASYNNSGDAFVARLNPAGSELVYATFLGGAQNDGGKAVALDGVGGVAITGWTGSSDFPATPDAFDPSYNGGYLDAFVARLNPAGSELVYATFLGGGRSYDYGAAIAVDEAGSATIAGSTWGLDDFPTTPNAFDRSFNGGDFDAFVARLNPAGSELAYATFLGGSHQDSGYGIAVDGEGSAVVTGSTRSSDFPVTPSAFDTSYNGRYYDGFVTKLKMGIGPWAVWRHSGDRVWLPQHGAEVIIDYGNLAPPVAFSASLAGSALFEDGSTAISQTLASGSDSLPLRLLPAPGASLGATFTLSATIGSLPLTTEGQVAAVKYLPLLVRRGW